jgi:hypothetical protein
MRQRREKAVATTTLSYMFLRLARGRVYRPSRGKLPDARADGVDEDDPLLQRPSIVRRTRKSEGLSDDQARDIIRLRQMLCRMTMI